MRSFPPVVVTGGSGGVSPTGDYPVNSITAAAHLSVVNAGTNARLVADSGTGANYYESTLSLRHGGLARWAFFKQADANAPLRLYRYDDAGNAVAATWTVNRQTGRTNIDEGLTVAGGLIADAMIVRNVGAAARLVADAGTGVSYYESGIRMQHGSLDRWQLFKQADANAPLRLYRYDDAGNALAATWTVNRQTGLTNIDESLAVTGTLTLTGDFAINTTKFTVAASSGNTTVAGTLTVAGTASVVNTGANAILVADSGTGANYYESKLVLKHGSIVRWAFFKEANANAFLRLYRYDDAGNAVAASWTVDRQTGRTSIDEALTVNGGLIADAMVVRNVGAAARLVADAGTGVSYYESGIRMQHGSLDRWQFFKQADANAPLRLYRYDDAGNAVAATWTVNRQTGLTNIDESLAVTGTLTLTSNFAINTTKFTVTASSGNTSIAGTLAVAAAVTLGAAAGTTGIINFVGTTSGSVALTVAAAAGTGTLTLPGATDTLVGRATTDTLTNKRIGTRVATITSNASITPDVSASDMHQVTAMAQALTINNPTGTPANGDALVIRLKDNGTSRALTWGAQFRAGNVALPAASIVSKTIYCMFFFNSADTKWDLFYYNDNF